ncbi:MAG: amino acid permease [Planctomycetes bacterium]|nr:amino acid permease [Planctomycetota bacterium]
MAHQPASLPRVLGPLQATCIVIGSVIGVGIFFTPSRVAAVAGSANLALLAWGIGAVIAMLGALCFAELGGLYTGSGGQYEILRDSYGPLPAFVFVFCNATAIQAGATAIISVVCMNNLGVLIRGAPPGDGVLPVGASLLIVGLAAANVLGVRFGAGIQVATVFAKVATLVVVSGIALFHTSATPHGAIVDAALLTHPAVAIAAALVPVCFSYGGWQHVLWIAGEVRDAQRNVPRAIVGGMVVVAIVYVSANWAYLALLGHAGVASSKALAADAVAVAWADGGRRLIAGAVALSAFGVLNAQLLSGPRLVYGMATDGRFFSPFAKVHRRFNTPYASIALIAGLALVLLWAAGAAAVDRLTAGVVAIDGLFFALTGFAVIVLRSKLRTAVRPVRTPGYPVVPILFALCELAVVCGAFLNADVRQSAVIAALWVAGAAFLYAVCFRGARVST